MKNATKGQNQLENNTGKINCQNVVSYYPMPKDYGLLKFDEDFKKKDVIDNDKVTINNYKNEIKFLRAKNKEIQEQLSKSMNNNFCQNCSKK